MKITTEYRFETIDKVLSGEAAKFIDSFHKSLSAGIGSDNTSQFPPIPDGFTRQSASIVQCLASNTCTVTIADVRTAGSP